MDIPWFSDVPDEPRRRRDAEDEVWESPPDEPEDLNDAAARENDKRKARLQETLDKAADLAKERADQVAKVRAERELAGVQKDFAPKLDDQFSHSDAAVEEIDERVGEDREDSLKQLDRAAKSLADLKHEYEQSAHRAVGDRPPEESKKRVADYGDRIDQKRKELDRRSHELRQEERAEQGHLLRVPGLVEISAPSMERVIVTHLARMVAIVAANHIVPGHGALIVRAFETLIQASTAPEKLDNASGLDISVPITVCNGLINLNVGIRLADDPGPPGSMPLILAFGPNFGGQPASHCPQVALVDAVPLPGKAPQYDEEGIKEQIEAEQRRHSEARKKLLELAHTTPDETATADGSDEDVVPESSPTTAEAAGEEEVRPPSESEREWPVEPRADQHHVVGNEQPGQGAVGRPERSAVGRPDPGSTGGSTRQPPRPQPTGVVIWGSARAIAAAAYSSLVSPDVLLALARKAVWDHLYDDRPGSVAAALDAVRSLEVILFLDFDIGGGLWIDVNPVTQEPCATLLVDMAFSASNLERFRLFYATT